MKTFSRMPILSAIIERSHSWFSFSIPNESWITFESGLFDRFDASIRRCSMPRCSDTVKGAARLCSLLTPSPRVPSRKVCANKDSSDCLSLEQRERSSRNSTVRFMAPIFGSFDREKTNDPLRRPRRVWTNGDNYDPTSPWLIALLWSISKLNYGTIRKTQDHFEIQPLNARPLRSESIGTKGWSFSHLRIPRRTPRSYPQLVSFEPKTTVTVVFERDVWRVIGFESVSESLITVRDSLTESCEQGYTALLVCTFTSVVLLVTGYTVDNTRISFLIRHLEQHACRGPPTKKEKDRSAYVDRTHRI